MNLTKIALAYCNRCHQPKPVARFLLPGWHHEYAICAGCLLFLARAIEEAPHVTIAPPDQRGT